MQVDSISVFSRCSVVGCGHPFYHRDLCWIHYDRQRRGRYSSPASTGNHSILNLPESETDRAYIAGLIDGEGCITRQKHYWRVKISMCDKEVIEWLHTYGGTVHAQQRKAPRRMVHEWSLAPQAQVVEFLFAVYPHMKLHAKREKARRAVSEIRAHGKVLGVPELI